MTVMNDLTESQSVLPFAHYRAEYLERNPPPPLLKDIYLSRRLTKAELLAELKGTIGEVSERTLTYYLNRGLVDKPLVAGKKEGKVKESYFSRKDVNKIKVARFLQKEGFTLEAIKKRIKHFDLVLRMAGIVAGQEQTDPLLEYFKGLCRLLVEHIPDDVTVETLRVYFNLILPDELDVATSVIENKVRRVVARIERVAEANVYSFKNSQRVFDITLAKFWDHELEVIYQGLCAGAATQEEIYAEALLENYTTRMLVFGRYFDQVQRTLDAMEEMFLS